MPAHLDLRLLSQFLTICGTSNMTAAGRQMGLSTPAVSQIVHRIERELGVVLFERSSRGIRLTPAGNLVRERARELLEAEHTILDALEPYRRQLLPKLRVHVMTSVANYIMPAIVAALNPMVGEIELRSGRLSHPVQDLLKGSIDILIFSEALLDIPDIERYRLCREELIALAPASLAAERLNLSWLSANLSMIRFQPGGTMDEMVEAYLGRQNLDPPRTIECSSPAPVVELIASGLGWTITAPFNVAYFRVLQGKAACMPLPQPLSTRDIFLIANAGRYLDVPSILAKACRAALREETRSWRGSPNEMLAQAVRIDSD